MLLFPLTWIVVAVVSFVTLGWIAMLGALILIPIAGYVSIIFFEELDKSVGGFRVLMFFLMRRQFFVRLLAERNVIRNEILSLGREGRAHESENTSRQCCRWDNKAHRNYFLRLFVVLVALLALVFFLLPPDLTVLPLRPSLRNFPALISCS